MGRQEVGGERASMFWDSTHRAVVSFESIASGCRRASDGPGSGDDRFSQSLRASNGRLVFQVQI
ncbi:hypothetical protein D9611_003503 [Ephemerocybe angulata]|uniref:Uncharacterized protein n=1 Tax=Ephemerocybe angulata TaxID=980116 RepID=A0A8H5B7H5_9AGAR|nr:hypothetical protein D9611_003503 [Tulosesus angulatus]